MSGPRCPFLEFASPASIRRLVDEDGRPVGEGKALDAFRHGVEMELRPSEAEDTRAKSDRPLNASAMRSVLEHWPFVTQRFAEIRAAFIAREGRTALSALDLWRVTHAMTSVVSFGCADRAGAPTVRARDAAVFKASAGMKFSLRHIRLARLQSAAGVPPEPLTAQGLWAYIARERLLIGESQVCAGPQKMIVEMLDLLVAGRAGARPAAGRPAPIERLLRYADALALWESAALLFRLDAFTLAVRAVRTAGGRFAPSAFFNHVLGFGEPEDRRMLVAVFAAPMDERELASLRTLAIVMLRELIAALPSEVMSPVDDALAAYPEPGGAIDADVRALTTAVRGVATALEATISKLFARPIPDRTTRSEPTLALVAALSRDCERLSGARI